MIDKAGGNAAAPIFSHAVSPEGSVVVIHRVAISDPGDTITFNCSSQGGPGNSYHWQRNGTDLPTETSDTLTIVNVNVSVGGDYSCVVSNDAGGDSATTTLYVAPVMVTQPMSIGTANGTVVCLTCRAEGFPSPAYTWTKDGVDQSAIPVPTTDGDGTSILKFSPVEFGDEGTYQCVAHSVISLSDPVAGGMTLHPAESDIATLTGMDAHS